jgi:hypothetical protein
MKTKKTKNGVEISRTYGMKSIEGRPTYIVVSHRSGAQVFARTASGLKKAREFPFPEGRQKVRAFVTDRPGRSFDSFTWAHKGQTGAPRHGTTVHETPSDHAMTILSERIANWLDGARKKNAFSALILVAEPRFLGRLKANLTTPTLRLVEKEKEKDYAWLTRPALENRLLTLTKGPAPRKPRVLPSPRGAYRLSHAS